MLVVITLYIFILIEALKKVNELKKVQRGLESNNNLRYFRGNNNDHEVSDDIAEQPRKFNFLHCCFSNVDDVQKNSKRKHPSKWKAIKIVLFTTLSFAVTWVKKF